jgi:hypothetical protein
MRYMEHVMLQRQCRTIAQQLTEQEIGVKILEDGVMKSHVVHSMSNRARRGSKSILNIHP